MKLFLLIIISIVISNNLFAQGVTKNGESTSTNNNFIDKTGKIISTPTINKYGQEIVLASLITSATSLIASTSVTCGGNITSDGGSFVTSRGVCWSLFPNPTITGSKTSDGTGSGIFTSSITGLLPNTTYYVRAYATNILGITYGNEISFKTALVVGDNYQGGKVAYILQVGDLGYIDGDIRGFIASPTDQSSGITWHNGSYTTTWALGTALGTGNANTNTIVASQGVGSYAARLCYDLDLGGYSDWYLPSKDELNKLYLNQALIGGFATFPNYWTSTEYVNNSNYAWCESFYDGYVGYSGKGSNNRIRAIRSFPSLPVVTTNSISSITSSTAVGGGNISSEEGENVTARGVCWNTTSGPTIANSKTIDGAGLGAFTSSLTGLTHGATYYVRAYATNSVGTSYGNEVSFIALPIIGDSYQGGKVAYIIQPEDPGYIEGEFRGFIAAPSDKSVGVGWWVSGSTTGAIATELGTGNSNTNTIVGIYGAGNYAAKYCYDLELGGYNDWCLPSKDELNKLYLNRAIIGGFNTTYYYWSSSEYDANNAYFQLYSNGDQGSISKGNNFSVRAIRSFPAIYQVTTTSASAITSTTAACGGNIINDGGMNISARGVCWSTSQNPTIANNKTTDGTGKGVFSSTITLLSGNTKYYTRAYATNAIGTIYGDEVNFTTNPPIIPTLTPTAASAVTNTTATSGGVFTSDGGAPITAKGVCWSTSHNPTTSNSKTNDGTGTGTFSSSITLLLGNTTYYVRAYAVNSVGTGYGDEISFTTNAATIPVLTTNSGVPTSGTIATSGGNISSDGGASVTIRGVCWSTLSGPTTSDSKTSNGTGAGTYSSTMSPLIFGTTYYVRAYATNSVGTAYGNEVSFQSGVGINYQGGIIAYFLQGGDQGYLPGEVHGLIIAPIGQSNDARWSNGANMVTGAIGTELGTGNANTNTIVSMQGVGSYAAQMCADLVYGGYNDWYLPSKDELNKVYLNRALIGGFQTNSYFSSSEIDLNWAWKQNFFGGGSQGSGDKNGQTCVRAIRSF